MIVLPVRACALPDTPLANASAGLDACVHCGFCLQACPTYVNLQDENDSPRGRLVLMRRLLEGELALDDPDVATHIDRCLGCRACETACPSGVPFGQLLEATRATMAPARGLPVVAATILGVFARRPLLTAALALARVFRATALPRLLARMLPHRLAFPMAMLASTAPVFRRNTRHDGGPRNSSPQRGARVEHADAASANGASAVVPSSRNDVPRGSVALLEGCVMRGLFAHTNSATERVMTANGYSVTTVGGQVCCGALHAHAGDLETARSLARRNIAAFEQNAPDLIVINSAGCGAMVKEYAHLLADDSAWAERAAAISLKARDVSELLAAAGPRTGSPLQARVTYDAPCHLMHAQRITQPPVAVLMAIPSLDLVPLADADQCCGSAGIYNLIEPETSDAVLMPKLARIAETGASYVATGNPGCLMQIGAGLMLAGSQARAVHPVDLLDASYAARQD